MTNEDAMNEEDPFRDRLDEVDREIRLGKLRRALEEAGALLPLDEDLPPDVEEAFLENILAFENAPRTTYSKMLITDGIFLPDPDSLAMEDITLKLWDVIHGLADQHTFLCHTNHLSDISLYRLLWNKLLNLETAQLPESPGAVILIDVLGTSSEEDLETYLRHYATEEDRLAWAGQLTGEMPDHVPPPYDRDQYLPQPPFAN